MPLWSSLLQSESVKYFLDSLDRIGQLVSHDTFSGILKSLMIFSGALAAAHWSGSGHTTLLVCRSVYWLGCVHHHLGYIYINF